MSSSQRPPCRFFPQGTCRAGDACRFPHVAAPAPPSAPSDPRRAAKPPCRFFAEGRCKFGDQCRFDHAKTEVPAGGPERATARAGATSAVERAVGHSKPSASARGGAVQGPARSQYKDGPPVCKFFARGSCVNGDKCPIVHERPGNTLTGLPVELLLLFSKRLDDTSLARLASTCSRAWAALGKQVRGIAEARREDFVADFDDNRLEVAASLVLDLPWIDRHGKTVSSHEARVLDDTQFSVTFDGPLLDEYELAGYPETDLPNAFRSDDGASDDADEFNSDHDWPSFYQSLPGVAIRPAALKQGGIRLALMLNLDIAYEEAWRTMRVGPDAKATFELPRKLLWDSKGNPRHQVITNVVGLDQHLRVVLIVEPSRGENKGLVEIRLYRVYMSFSRLKSLWRHYQSEPDHRLQVLDELEELEREGRGVVVEEMAACGRCRLKGHSRDQCP
ncbi:hypothetical protein DFJ74DRAFT_747937 [Hyaloraphidium curvatum]|nr:hypothetical protein DFJ74DRAFT_747937 [Hyaloraphidium curvatum]